MRSSGPPDETYQKRIERCSARSDVAALRQSTKPPSSHAILTLIPEDFVIITASVQGTATAAFPIDGGDGATRSRTTVQRPRVFLLQEDRAVYLRQWFWNRIVARLFGVPRPRKTGQRRRVGGLQVESLEARVTPAVFTASPLAPDNPAVFAPRESLRNGILQANLNADALNTIHLSAGIYSLTDFADGNLVIQNGNSLVPTKTLFIVGQGGKHLHQGSSSWNDRIFEVIGSPSASVKVVFEKLTIEGGKASGGGVLGGTAARRWRVDRRRQVTFSHVAV